MDIAGDADPTAIDISADDYARAAATDQATPSAADRNARTHQTEETFQAEKATYVAKQDNGNIWKNLSNLDPPFRPAEEHRTEPSAAHPADSSSPTKKKFPKKEWLLVIAAVGELYWAADYIKILEICDWAQGDFELEPKMADSVVRWREKSSEKIRASTT